MANDPLAPWRGLIAAHFGTGAVDTLATYGTSRLVAHGDTCAVCYARRDGDGRTTYGIATDQAAIDDLCCNVGDLGGTTYGAALG